jgi:hypothetical protein
MDAEDKSKYDIEQTGEKLSTVEQTISNLCNETIDEGLADAERVIDLTDEEDALDTTLTHERERHVGDWG